MPEENANPGVPETPKVSEEGLTISEGMDDTLEQLRGIGQAEITSVVFQDKGGKNENRRTNQETNSKNRGR